MAAAFIAPEIAIDESEAKELTAALAQVNTFYSKVVDPKVIAWVGLIGVCGKIYGPRVGAYTIRKASERRKNVRPDPMPGTQTQQQTPQKPSNMNGAAPARQATMMEILSRPDFVQIPTPDSE